LRGSWRRRCASGEAAGSTRVWPLLLFQGRVATPALAFGQRQPSAPPPPAGAERRRPSPRSCQTSGWCGWRRDAPRC
jgi:hypothetical protein